MKQAATGRQTSDPGPTYFNPEEAAGYLGVTSQAFGSLVKQYGVGRYHINRAQDQIVYRQSDLDSIKRGLVSQVKPGESEATDKPSGQSTTA